METKAKFYANNKLVREVDSSDICSIHPSINTDGNYPLCIELNNCEKITAEGVDFVNIGRKQEHLSEEDKHIVNVAISFLGDFASQGYENAVMCIDWLKSLK